MLKLRNALLDRLKAGNAGVWFVRAGQLLLVLVAGTALFSAGCGKKEQGQPTTSSTNAASQSAQPAAAAPSTAVPALVATAPEGGADLRDLNHAYIRWVVQTRRHVKTFEEFAAASGISVPPAPAGKKYVIDKAGFIALANQ